MMDLEQVPVTVKTRKGREVRKPVWFLRICCDSHGQLPSKEGKSCKDQVKILRNESCEEEAQKATNLVAVV